VRLVIHGAFLLLFPWLRDQLLNLVAESIVELVSVLLHPHVHGLPIELESTDEALRNEVGLLGLLQVCEYSLELIEDVTLDGLLFRRVIGFELDVKDALA
jgi:hypothetical protein